MRTPLLFALAALLSLAAAPTPAHADGWGLDDVIANPADWHGFPVGTMVHTRTTSVTDIPQMGRQETVMEEKKTLLRVEGSRFFLKVETLVEGNWIESEEVDEPGDPDQVTFEDAGSGSLTIQGTEYACAKKRAVSQGGDYHLDGAVFWVHSEHGVLKVEQLSESVGWTVTRLSVSHQVGDVTLDCREVSLSTGAPGMTNTMLLSTAVPGRMVRMEMTMAQGPVKNSSVTELVALVKP